MNRWKFDGPIARLDCNSFTAALDCRSPQSGLAELSRRDRRLESAVRLLGVGSADRSAGGDADYEPSLAESYARAEDLVVTYPQTAQRPFRLQPYWRVDTPNTPAHHDVDLCVELQVSINTSLLDTHPAVEVVSDFLGANSHVVELGGNSLVVVRPAGADWSYVEMVHPVDRGEPTALVADNDRLALRTRLFGKFLEKGVILRARMRGAIVRRDGDEAAALALYEDFRHAPLPLTT